MTPELEVNSISSECTSIENLVLRHACYFDSDDGPLFGWVHTPTSGNTSDLALLICPSIGYEYASAHSTLRHLADQFCRAGFASMRFDYHGTGNSDGIDEDVDRVPAWLRSIKAAAKQLKLTTGCGRIGLVGLRMGATLASVVASETKIDCLIAWAPCLQGRHFSREMKMLEESLEPELRQAHRVEEGTEGGGFFLSKQTASDLSAIKLANLIPLTSKILIVGRDDLQDIFKLRDKWSSNGTEVYYERMTGYSDLMLAPHFAIVPKATITLIADWVHHHFPANRISLAPPLEIIDTVEIGYRNYIASCPTIETLSISEKLFNFGANRNLFGILSAPLDQSSSDSPIFIFPNSGGVHQVGTNRLHVLLARHLAQQGYTSLRMDIKGLGDSISDDLLIENKLYRKGASSDVSSALDELQKAFGSDRKFIVGGLCYGAYLSFRTALNETRNRISECLLFNPLTFHWHEGMSLDENVVISDLRRLKSYENKFLNMKSWMKLLKGQVKISPILRALRMKLKILLPSSNKFSGTKSKHDLTKDLAKISDSGIHISFFISDKDPGHEILMMNAPKQFKEMLRQDKATLNMFSYSKHSLPMKGMREDVFKTLTAHIQERYPIL